MSLYVLQNKLHRAYACTTIAANPTHRARKQWLPDTLRPLQNPDPEIGVRIMFHSLQAASPQNVRGILDHVVGGVRGRATQGRRWRSRRRRRGDGQRSGTQDTEPRTRKGDALPCGDPRQPPGAELLEDGVDEAAPAGGSAAEGEAPRGGRAGGAAEGPEAEEGQRRRGAPARRPRRHWRRPHHLRGAGLAGEGRGSWGFAIRGELLAALRSLQHRRRVEERGRRGC